MKMYCVKDRKKVEVKNAKIVITKNKRRAYTGTCPKCGTKTFQFTK